MAELTRIQVKNMSGHSRWKKIKHQKETADAKRSQLFSKIARMITVAAKQGGGEPNSNSVLRMAIEKAKYAKMPSDNIERAIKRGSGESEDVKLEEFLFEAYGPGNIAIIIEGITDNTNRSLSEVKQILNQHNGKLANAGSVQWLFRQKGIIVITKEDNPEQSKDDLEMTIIEAGAEDMDWQEGQALEVRTSPEKLEQVKKTLEQENIKIASAGLGWVAKDEIEAEEKNKQAVEKLFETLDENDDVQEIYSNLKA